MVLTADSESNVVYFRLGKEGGCLAQTGKCIIVGLYNESNAGQSGGVCNNVVEKLAQALAGSGY